jgi:hypothetical protein
VRRFLTLLLLAACSSPESGPVQPDAGPLARRDDGGGGSDCTPTNPLVITTESMPNGNVGTFYGNFITSRARAALTRSGSSPGACLTA